MYLLLTNINILSCNIIDNYPTYVQDSLTFDAVTFLYIKIRLALELLDKRRGMFCDFFLALMKFSTNCWTFLNVLYIETSLSAQNRESASFRT